MSRFIRKLPFAAGIILYLLAFLSCQNPLASAGTDVDPSAEVGALVVQISSLAARTLLPTVDMEVASYVVTGSGPESSTFNQPTTSSPVVVPDLKLGSWTVTVDALNAAGIAIGQGEQTVTIQDTKTTPVAVTVKPRTGYGTLSLTVTWNAAEVGSPAIQAQLVPVSGSTLNLGFSVTAGMATYSSTTIPTGYYTLVLQLQDGGTLVMGAVETVRIVKDAVTSGTFDFQDINGAGGQITVNITPEMSNPITVALSGQVSLLDQGSSMTLTASVPAGTGNVVYAWYLNGVSQATGKSYAVGSTLPVGFYRLDVTAFTADGKRAGSTSHSFQVLAVQLTQANLAWDANSETDLAGYKIYYGLASGTYTSVVDVGNKTVHVLSGLQAGKNYYISATAYDSGGLESTHSTEVVFSGT